MRGGRNKRRRGVRRAHRSSLEAASKGRRIAAEVAGGRTVDAEGDPELVEVLARALAAASGAVDRHTHGFHTYPARMHPDTARALVETLGGERLHDPFCGGGTVLVEALVAGRRASGADIHPVAELVAWARTRLLGAEAREALEAEGRRIAAVARRAASERLRIPDAVYRLRKWYDPRALRELTALWQAIDEAQQPGLLRAVHSSLVVKYSHRASDTSAKRVRRRHREGAVTRAFASKAHELTGMLGALAEAAPDGVEPSVRLADARAPGFGPVDLVVTSPPYPATYDYVPLQELRLAWLDTEVGSHARGEIGSRRHFRRSVRDGYERWIRDTQAWTRRIGKELAPGGRLAVVVGDGIARGRLLEARAPSRAAAERAGLRLVAGCSKERADPGMQLAKREHALVFEKEP